MITLNDFKRLIRPMLNKLFLIVGRGTLETTDPGIVPGKVNQQIKTTLLRDETIDKVPHVQPYGFESRPVEGAEVIVTCINGNREQAIAIVVGDRRYRPITLIEGEVMIYSKFGQSLLFKDDGSIMVIAPGGFMINGVEIGLHTHLAGTPPGDTGIPK